MIQQTEQTEHMIQQTKVMIQQMMNALSINLCK
ncbi:hypothetical protein J2X07_000555 [Fictibacillus barbaricus]|uniref:Uncharacterized protein n=1 Tax=Fictibacillus barbaricus TaxID=182136 RepID=A0ABU1TWJ4_9BACL|nr:hypothetical protein [Fictibacillus barbaricus]